MSAPTIAEKVELIDRLAEAHSRFLSAQPGVAAASAYDFNEVAKAANELAKSITADLRQVSP